MTIASELTLLNNTKTAIADAIEDKGITVGSIPFSQYPDKIAEISGGGEAGEWVRPSDWLPLPTVTDTESKFVGLHAVWPDANFLALSATGNYTVNWGDGVTENFNSGDTAYHIYDYSTISSDTDTSRGYRQVIVIVTPQVGATFTNINLNVKHNQTGLQAYTSGWLDILISGPELTSLQIAGNTATAVVRHASLEQAQLISNNNIASFDFVFNLCRKLQSVPVWKIRNSGAVSLSGMFTSCFSLTKLNLFDTQAVTNMSIMFNSCSSLQEVPLFNTSSVTNMSNMFVSCLSIQTIPLFDTQAVTNMNNMFNACANLQLVPSLSTTSVTSSGNFSSIFANCLSLTRIEAKDFRWTFSVANCKLSDVRLKEIFTNLPRVTTSQTLTVTGNYGIGTITSKASLSLTAGSTTISMANTSGVVNGMFVTGTGTAINTNVSVTSNVTNDTLTKTAHGLSNGDKISFSALSTTTGILTWTIYYVVNKTDNDFQIALSDGGAPIDLTGSNATMSMRYPSFVTNVVTNTSVTISTPLASTGTQTLTFRELDSSEALLKNWAVTF